MHWSRMASPFTTFRPSLIQLVIPTAILCIISLKSSEAYQNFTVGDGQGWGLSSASANNGSFYQEWAAGKNFTLGDFLLFSYPSMNENVAVTKNRTTYENCDVYSSAVTEVWGEAGNSTYSEVPLVETGETYFMSGAEGGDHCASGVRFAINVTHGDGLPPGFILPSPPSDDNDSPPDNTGSGSGYSFPSIDDIPPPPPPPSFAPASHHLSYLLLLCTPFLLHLL